LASIIKTNLFIINEQAGQFSEGFIRIRILR
jgi:hypothetical protein